MAETFPEEFFHRGLNCLVAIELKVDRFEPEHLGKLNFYLEALDRDVRKPHENPAIGVLLSCKRSKTWPISLAWNRQRCEPSRFRRLGLVEGSTICTVRAVPS